MQTFKEKYLSACETNDIQPLDDLLDRLILPSGGPKSQLEDLNLNKSNCGNENDSNHNHNHRQGQNELDKGVIGGVKKIQEAKYNHELNLANTTISSKVSLS
jgi:hypothetical protein